MMQTFKKGNICLDKTIALSKQISKGEVEPSEILEVNTYCGEPVSFEFAHFKGIPSTPIEHIGLAQLVYEKAIDQFSTTRIGENGQTERDFEPLPSGSHIADVLKNCEADTLAWYKDKENNPFKFSTLYNGIHRDMDLNHYQKTITFNSQDKENFQATDDRFKAAALAICEAMATYQEALVEEGFVQSNDQLSDALVEESKAMNKELLAFRERAVAAYGQQEENLTENIPAATEDCVQ